MVPQSSAELLPPQPAPAPHMGRPTKFTPETQAILLEHMTAGYTIKMSCEAADIDPVTYTLWRQAADGGDPRYTEFFSRVRLARMAAKKKLVDEWHAVGANDWRSKARYLAVLDPEDFSEQRQLRIEQHGEVKHAHVHVHTLLPAGMDNVAQLASLLGIPEPTPLLDMPVEAIESHGDGSEPADGVTPNP